MGTIQARVPSRNEWLWQGCCYAWRSAIRACVVRMALRGAAQGRKRRATPATTGSAPSARVLSAPVAGSPS